MADFHTAHLHGGPLHGQQIALAEAPLDGTIVVASAEEEAPRQGRYTAVRGHPGNYEWSGYSSQGDIEP